MKAFNWLTRRDAIFAVLRSFAIVTLFPSVLTRPLFAQDDHEDDEAILADVKNVERLQEIKDALSEFKGVTGVGPFEDDGKTCVVLAKPAIVDAVPKQVKLKDGGDIKLRVIPHDSEAKLFADPPQFPGPVMGGDPIKNDKWTDYGTVGFGTDAAAGTLIEGYSCAGQLISCSHVLFHVDDDVVSTPLYPQKFQTKWNVSQNSPRFIDVAGAKPAMGTPYRPKWLRGLREIMGVEYPTGKTRVSKYGRRTGLTSGFYTGWILRTLWGTPYYVRAVLKDGFSLYGDSGAAVVTSDRKLVGLVFAGDEGLGETYIMQAWRTSMEIPDNWIVFRVKYF